MGHNNVTLPKPNRYKTHRIQAISRFIYFPFFFFFNWWTEAPRPKQAPPLNVSNVPHCTAATILLWLTSQTMLHKAWSVQKGGHFMRGGNLGVTWDLFVSQSPWQSLEVRKKVSANSGEATASVTVITTVLWTTCRWGQCSACAPQPGCFLPSSPLASAKAPECVNLGGQDCTQNLSLPSGSWTIHFCHIQFVT